MVEKKLSPGTTTTSHKVENLSFSTLEQVFQKIESNYGSPVTKIECRSAFYLLLQVILKEVPFHSPGLAKRLEPLRGIPLFENNNLTEAFKIFRGKEQEYHEQNQTNG